MSLKVGSNIFSTCTVHKIHDFPTNQEEVSVCHSQNSFYWYLQLSIHRSCSFKVQCIYKNYSTVFQCSALAEPGGPWRLTFALERLENHTNHMLGTLNFTGSKHWAPFYFP